MKHIKEYNRFITESNRDPKSIQKEYKDLKKQSITNLRQEWSRMNKVGNPNQLDKEGLISDILRQRHGDKYVDAAFESVTESAMSELDLLAKEAKDFKAFTKEVFKEFKNLPKKLIL